ncbi:hypothetical protein VNI00_009752 [Paramarasmius palmivorus]|uniref:ABC transporter domain-containing protein n=1 Tax=Paramarasmius palmivorus TaxID=297713 RepID=A0AAW0CN85_9AGAR
MDRSTTDKQSFKYPRDDLDYDATALEAIHAGVYRILLEKKPFKSLEISSQRLYFIRDKWVRAARVLRRVVVEIFWLAPVHLTITVIMQLWMRSITQVVLVGLENRILHTMEVGLRTQTLDSNAVIGAIFARMACWIMHTFSYAEPWRALENLITILSDLFSIVGQIGLVLSSVRAGEHGLVFALICLLRPLGSTLSRSSIMNQPRIIETTHPDFNRMQALRALTDKKYRQDLISGNIVGYLVDEYRKAREGLGDASTYPAEFQHMRGNSSIGKSIVHSILGDLPVIYYAALALINPSQISLASIATVQRVSSMLQSCVGAIMWSLERLEHSTTDCQRIYDLCEMKNVIIDGHLSYPHEKKSEKGMSFELRNVSFSYPGSKDNAKALENVSLQIAAGEMIVVVGANGSGKSTFVNLLTRLYDATEGEILVDGQKIKDYKLADFRQATGTLTQEHQLYPLSIAENVGMGHVESMSDPEKIREAARKGGAEMLVKKLPLGLESVLESKRMQYGAMVNTSDKGPLAEHLRKLKKTSDVSGGERQRLVAARTFMRLNSEKLKFLAIDEPTSALDPEGELELFNNLRAARYGKTMVFITHRFGPLTKYADRIICMKEGKVVESGTHSRLMDLNGEYSKMFNIQAQAFENSSSASVE